jgi:hypothetical protein
MSNERTAEEWGRVAVALPGWRWMPGMGCINPGMPQMWCRRIGDECSPHYSFLVPDPDDPATAGCLLALLGSSAWDNVAPGSAREPDGAGWWAWDGSQWSEGMTLGRACIAAAEALGRWPGGKA